MLTKSQARTFFVGFTVLFSGVFLGLTVDTVMQVPERSNEDQMTEQVIKGKEIWEANNCMGCHTILGEGGYYAPELTKVVERRGEAWIRIFIKDPEAMYPGRRRMVKYDFSEEEITEVIAFLDWVGKIDTNGFPRAPDMTTAGIVSAANAAPAAPGGVPGGSTAKSVGDVPPAPAFFSQVCQACHAVGGTGGAVGPALDGVATRYTAEALDLWLKDPQAVKPGTAMPNLGLPDETRAELVTWLMKLD